MSSLECLALAPLQWYSAVPLFCASFELAQLTLITALRCTQVYKGHHKTSGRVVAIKAISLAKLDKRALSNLESEISIMRRTRHPNIVRLLDIQVCVDVFARGPMQPSHTITLSTPPRILVQKSEKYIYLILEYCGGGDLSRLIRKKGPLSEQRTKELMRQLGTEQCHTTQTHTLLQLQRPRASLCVHCACVTSLWHEVSMVQQPCAPRPQATEPAVDE